jgi:hypothetical protein
LASKRWREKDDVDWTLPKNFRDHFFNNADKEHLHHKLTAQAVGYPMLARTPLLATGTSPPLTAPSNAAATAPFSMHFDGAGIMDVLQLIIKEI